jgi:hypothetical protein
VLLAGVCRDATSWAVVLLRGCASMRGRHCCDRTSRLLQGGVEADLAGAGHQRRRRCRSRAEGPSYRPMAMVLLASREDTRMLCGPFFPGVWKVCVWLSGPCGTRVDRWIRRFGTFEPPEDYQHCHARVKKTIRVSAFSVVCSAQGRDLTLTDSVAESVHGLHIHRRAAGNTVLIV